ncbi:MAG: response regulator, partial [Verrucomicrobiae bacterium]|nr:response regulator [Verrucomicrobiae bacterium]
RLLGEVGFDLRFAETGRVAVEMVETWDPEFVWMDIKMPEMDGEEATRRIRERHGDALPIVALTASVLSVDRERLIRSGFNEVLMKPARPAELFDAMARFLQVRYLTRETAGEASTGASGGGASLSGLGRLPEALQRRLRECIDLGDLDGIKSCVTEIRDLDPEVAEALTEPLANFAFERIVNAMDETREDH